MKLREYFDRYGIMITRFAKIANVPVQTIYHVMWGEDIRLSSAIRIVEATKGQVDYKDLVLPDSEKRKKPKKKSPKPQKGE